MKLNEVKITVPSSLENLSLIRAMVKTYLELHQVSQRDVFQLLSVVDEQNTHTEEQDLPSLTEFKKDEDDKDSEKDEDTKELQSSPCKITQHIPH